ncbi:MAG TPA: hypothetical protein VFC65_04385 [Prolixibacteraceae bacterium]|nr:hypothetical protein [Prolixibacteraceae bacterium]
MKKQILFLVFLVLAVFAGVDSSSGQSVAGTAPRPLVCDNDALHPIAGKAYTYTVAATPLGGQYTWWATKDENFIVAGDHSANLATQLTTASDLNATSANYGAANAATDVSITWSTSILSATTFQGDGVSPNGTPTFVAVHYAAPVAGCTDNFKVFELDPKNGFTVDILNMDYTAITPLGFDVAETQCFAPVSSATYVAGDMSYLYGVNIMYFEVVAANFSGSWTPTFQLTGLTGTQTAVIEWDYTTGFAAPKTEISGTQSTTPVATTVTDTSNGVSIYVRVTITNNSFEGLAQTPITLAVDGENAAGELDVINTTCVEPAAADFADLAIQTLDERPTVIEGTSSILGTSVGIIPKNP